ncbi:uncharacterized protein LOC118446006 [Vespa mandarinia]|uniref:uncharacterized protein LOC118446006 n=1 Tax=Vespa mandarinia TaxID=7446 RepID=UPI00161A38E8|nr:uncharacterized protein LOC118446006 [Vespa mandarinia]
MIIYRHRKKNLSNSSSSSSSSVRLEATHCQTAADSEASNAVLPRCYTLLDRNRKKCSLARSRESDSAPRQRYIGFAHLAEDGRAGSWERFRKATTMIAVEGNRLHALKIRWTTRNAEEDPDRRAVAGRQLFPKPKRRDRLCLCIDIGGDTSAGNKRAFIVSPMMLLADSEWGKARLISCDSARGSSR